MKIARPSPAPNGHWFTSTPSGKREGLTDLGKQYVERLMSSDEIVEAERQLGAEGADEATVREIGDRLTKMLGRQVVPHVTVNPAIVGGIIVKYGDRVLDGSLRRRLLSLKREMLHARLPHDAATGA